VPSLDCKFVTLTFNSVAFAFSMVGKSNPAKTAIPQQNLFNVTRIPNFLNTEGGYMAVFVSNRNPLVDIRDLCFTAI
jgi:hypothetical protein